MKKYNIAILGATGMVGESLLEILHDRAFPVENLYPLASARSAGEEIRFGNRSVTVIDAADFDFSKADIAFFSAGGELSKQYVPIATQAGCVVIDNTSAYRYDPEIPLIVPEVNSHRIQDYKNKNIIANPNCSTIQMLVALKPIYDAVGIKSIVVSTYQSVSGAGRSATTELAEQTRDLMNGKGSSEGAVFPKNMAFNVLPHIDVFQDNGYTKEEMKMIWETHKILEDATISVNPTAVRVPVFYGHSESIYIQTQAPMTPEEAKACLRNAPGVILVEDDEDYPTPITHASGQDAVFVGRIRQDLFSPTGLQLWVVADNIRKGAALNSIQIAELLINSSASV